MNNHFLYLFRNGKRHCLWHINDYLIPRLKLSIPQANMTGDSESCAKDRRAKGSEGSTYTATIIRVLAKELPSASRHS